MPTFQLTPRQRATLKARAHPLEPVAHIGQVLVLWRPRPDDETP